MFYEIVVAPEYTEQGLATLKGKSKTLRILEAKARAKGKQGLRQVGGGWLLQDADDKTPEDIEFKVRTVRIVGLILLFPGLDLSAETKEIDFKQRTFKASARNCRTFLGLPVPTLGCLMTASWVLCLDTRLVPRYDDRTPSLW